LCTWRPCDNDHTRGKRGDSGSGWHRGLMTSGRGQLPKVACRAVALALIGHDGVSRRLFQADGVTTFLREKRDDRCLLLPASCELQSLPAQFLRGIELSNQKAHLWRRCNFLHLHESSSHPLVAIHALLAISTDNIFALVPWTRHAPHLQPAVHKSGESFAVDPASETIAIIVFIRGVAKTAWLTIASFLTDAPEVFLRQLPTFLEAEGEFALINAKSHS